MIRGNFLVPISFYAQSNSGLNRLWGENFRDRSSLDGASNILSRERLDPNGETSTLSTIISRDDDSADDASSLKVDDEYIDETNFSNDRKRSLPPSYSCTVFKKAVLWNKMEFEQFVKPAPVRRWRKMWVIIRGTLLCLHGYEPNLPLDAGPGPLMAKYSLAFSQVGVAKDYLKHHNCFRVRVGSQQLLFRAPSSRELVSWVETFQCGANIALDLDMMTFPTIATSSRRRRATTVSRSLDIPGLNPRHLLSKRSKNELQQRIYQYIIEQDATRTSRNPRIYYFQPSTTINLDSGRRCRLRRMENYQIVHPSQNALNRYEGSFSAFQENAICRRRSASEPLEFYRSISGHDESNLPSDVQQQNNIENDDEKIPRRTQNDTRARRSARRNKAFVPILPYRAAWHQESLIHNDFLASQIPLAQVLLSNEGLFVRVIAKARMFVREFSLRYGISTETQSRRSK